MQRIFVQSDNITKEEEDDLILEQIKEEYGFDDIKEFFNEGKVTENIYFFYGGESENFYRAVEFMGPDAENREFAAFLMFDMGRQVMASNRLLIHVETGDIFYENHNTGENFYNFLVTQKSEEAAFIPKKFSYLNTFEIYISQFLQEFSLDDVEKKKYLKIRPKIQNIYFIVLRCTLKLMEGLEKKSDIPESMKTLLVCKNWKKKANNF